MSYNSFRDSNKGRINEIMYCPGCGLEEIHTNQFCRACGTDLRSVRVMLESPDEITASAVSARDEIGRAIAAKIQQTSSANELAKFADSVLPEIEKFLESPEERKMRRVRTGSLVSFVGLGVTIAFSIVSQFEKDLVILAGFGLVTLFIGLALLINGLFFTIPNKSLQQKSTGNEFEDDRKSINATTNELLMPASAQMEFSSVTDHTTRHLKDKKPV